MSRASEHTVRDRLLRFGGPLLAASLGIALEVSDVHSISVQIAAWAVVVVSVVVLVTGAVAAGQRCARRRHARRKRTSRPKRARLGAELASLGHRIVAFKHQRDARAPRPRRMDSSIRHPVQAARARRAHVTALAAHEDDTLALYDRRFSADVRTLVSELLTLGVLGYHEAQELLGPQTAAMIEDVGLRLVELGKRHDRRGHAEAA